jgi:hypothetical protein
MRYLLFFSILLTACSPQHRLQHLLDRHPELAQTDTIRATVATVVPADTVFRPIVLRTSDTVTVETERQVIRLVRIPTGSPCDTAAVQAELTSIIKTDTLYQRIEIPVERLVPCPEGKQVAAWWRVVAIVLALVLGGVLYLRR